ncbi:Fe-S cluster assembly protein SufD [Microvirga massiliensis]|uniref:Fe-S cluster assembly protein SufD n=1 Tax=Microvirga massiliensis TaxID=1033741 RepID=UPI00062B64F8|nr:Fe-S cluster assembly protein SufD [Microvirga massiliensis]
MANMTLIKNPAEQSLADAFAAVHTSLPGNAKLREQAFRSFSQTGLPHRRVEEFKYTDLRSAMREVAPRATQPSKDVVARALARPSAFSSIDAVELVFVDGFVASDLASGLTEGIHVQRLNEELEKDRLPSSFPGSAPAIVQNPLYQLNTAFVADGVVIHVSGEVAKPIHLRFVSRDDSAVAASARVVMKVDEGARITLLESHESVDGIAHQPNHVVEIEAGDRAQIDHIRLNTEGADVMALSTLMVRLGTETTFNTLNTVLGSSLSRHQVFAECVGDRSVLQIYGATMIRREQLADTTLVVDHSGLGCVSRELFKTVMDGNAIGVFQGKIVVRHEAQKTDGRMMSAALLLSDGATMNNKPELEIFADDVQCAHGATSGALDDDLLFYLMARGLPRAEAERLLVQAFLGEALEVVSHDGIEEALVGLAEQWLRERT